MDVCVCVSVFQRTVGSCVGNAVETYAKHKSIAKLCSNRKSIVDNLSKSKVNRYLNGNRLVFWSNSRFVTPAAGMVLPHRYIQYWPSLFFFFVLRWAVNWFSLCVSDLCLLSTQRTARLAQKSEKGTRYHNFEALKQVPHKHYKNFDRCLYA